jgi:ABC-type Na+ transport system ATPase subunit NatA
MTLELRNVSKRFPGVLAVGSVSFKASMGEITGYLGSRVSSRVVILHRGKVVADDSIEHLRVLRCASTLEDVSRSSPLNRTLQRVPARSPT